MPIKKWAIMNKIDRKFFVGSFINKFGQTILLQFTPNILEARMFDTRESCECYTSLIDKSNYTVNTQCIVVEIEIKIAHLYY